METNTQQSIKKSTKSAKRTLTAVEETQRFQQVWIGLILTALAGLFLWGFVQQVFFDAPWGNFPISDVALLLMAVIPVALLVLYRRVKLQLLVDGEGIHYRFIPVQGQYRHIYWHQVSRARVRRIKAIEQGSFPLKLAMDTANSAKEGLEVSLEDGRRVMFGTKKSRDLNRLLDELKAEGLL